MINPLLIHLSITPYSLPYLFGLKKRGNHVSRVWGVPPSWVVGYPTLWGFVGVCLEVVLNIFPYHETPLYSCYSNSHFDPNSLILFKAKTNYGLVVKKSARVTFMLKLFRFNDVL